MKTIKKIKAYLNRLNKILLKGLHKTTFGKF